MNLVDRIAAIEHRQWAQWAQKIIDTEPELSKERSERWKNLISISYENLSEEWKEYDREWAREVLRECRLQLEEDAYTSWYDEIRK